MTPWFWMVCEKIKYKKLNIFMDFCQILDCRKMLRIDEMNFLQLDFTISHSNI